MAFTGTAVLEQISDAIVRVTGLSLAEGASGSLVLAANPSPGSSVVLPAGFKPQPANYGNNPVGLVEAIDVTAKQTGVGAGTPTIAKAIYITKAGDTPQTFTATIQNNDAVEGGSTGALEIYVKFHE